MNKPILAAASGVLFGAFLGVTVYSATRPCQISAEVIEVPLAVAPVEPAAAPTTTISVVTIQSDHRFERTITVTSDKLDSMRFSDLAGESPCVDGKPDPAMVSLIASREVDTVLSSAQIAYVNGDYRCAAEIARAELGHKSTPAHGKTRAWRIVGAAACNLEDLALADRSFRHLDAPGRQFMTYVCQRNGLVRVGSHFRLADDDQDQDLPVIP